MTAKVKLPDFLKGVKVSESEMKELRVDLSNWLALHKKISKLRPSKESITYVKKFMLTEYQRTDGPRMDIIVRLHQRLNLLRREMERVELSGR